MTDAKKPATVDRVDGYNPTTFAPPDPTQNDVTEALAAMAHTDAVEAVRTKQISESNLAQYEKALFDGYVNEITGFGLPSADKTLGGLPGGPCFELIRMTSAEASDRWRGSALGKRVVETYPDEMTRRGWTVEVQPDEDDDEPRADSVWSRLLARIGIAKRRDDFPSATRMAPPTDKPGALPEQSEQGTEVSEQILKQQRALGLKDKTREGIEYETAYGGGAILVGVDDGKPLYTPLTDFNNIRYLTVFRGGWDGELTAWRWYGDAAKPKFGEPEIYMLRNIGVPVAGAPAPGENPGAVKPATGLVYFVHESRLLIFKGRQASRYARVEMRGWSDSVFTHVDDALNKDAQTWNGVAILMAEYSIAVMKMKGLATNLALEDGSGLALIQTRMRALAMSMAVTKTRLIDSEESLDRMTVTMSGVAEVLRESSLRVAAAAHLPLSKILGQTVGGLGDTTKGDQEFLDDEVSGRQETDLRPEIEKFVRLQFLAKKGPTKGVIPKRWELSFNPLTQMSAKEEAVWRKDIALADQVYLSEQVVSPEEVAATRFGGAKFNPGAIVLDLVGRARQQIENAKNRALAARAPTQALPPSPGGNKGPPPPQGTPTQSGETSGNPPEQDTVPVRDAADFVTRGGRTKVRTVAAVGAVYNERGEELFGVHATSGKYKHPGGMAEPGETPAATLGREVFEETGLHPIRVEYLGSKSVQNGDHVTKVHAFAVVVRNGSEPTNDHDPDKEFKDFRWFDTSHGYPDELATNLHHPRDVVRELMRRRRR